MSTAVAVLDQRAPLRRPRRDVSNDTALGAGMSVQNVDGRVVLVDVEDFIPNGCEMVVLRHDGRYAIMVPQRIRIGAGERSFLGPVQIEEGRRASYGVTVLGRVVREWPI